ncbi:hypothetical protein T07_164 [Trichinella nelsoni]|uniref:Uncharacterized protein n=1 Tax=Trichinella nelsoni TaxID=6336 RepID=A0A0V0S3T6_9BILA|nr:hypothetical protein T07_164 [Trichinella nelsoni]
MLADLKCCPSVNERRNILIGVTYPLERCAQDTGRAKTRRTSVRKGSCALIVKGTKQPFG